MEDTELRQRHQPPCQNLLNPKHTDTPEDDDIDLVKKNAQRYQRAEPHRHAGSVRTALTLAAFFVTFFKIWYPAQVVFDEVHFGKFAGYYLRREFFFDVHPPLAKMLYAGVGYLIGYGGHFDFGNIGESYIKNNVPYIGLRAFPALLNVLNVPIIFGIMQQSGYATVACAIPSLMYLFDNAMVGQNRLMLLDSILLFFMLSTIYAYICFYRTRHNAFSFSWWFWLFATGVGMSLTLGVKMVGLFTIATVGFAVVADLWKLLDAHTGLSVRKFMLHFGARAFALIAVPTALYLFWFYIHFEILNQSGTGDVYMSAQFQATLQNSPLSLKSLDIHYYDKITFSHKETGAFLHSHPYHYPLRYEDGRISSQGQQVTGIMEPDENSYWLVKPAVPFDDDDKEKRRVVRDGDIIQLEHVGTGKNLLTHDVAAPWTPTNQEFTVVPQGERYNETLFKVLLNDNHNGNKWQTHMKSFFLIHVNTNVALFTHDMALPDWGFGHNEVNGNKKTKETRNYWVAQDIWGVNATEVNENKKKQTEPMPFLEKFWELQTAMIRHNADLTEPHPYQSSPLTWPLMLRGISYWTNDDKKEQIYLTGNVVGWWAGLAAVGLYSFVLAANLIATKRSIHLLSQPLYNRFIRSAGFFTLLWFSHYVPFFGMGRALFLHHYLPAAAYGYLVLGAMFQFVFIRGAQSPISPRHKDSQGYVSSQFTPLMEQTSLLTYIAAAMLVVLQLNMFIFLAPITYGTPGLTSEEVNLRKIMPSWDMQYSK